jgi:hypothetical protein
LNYGFQGQHWIATSIPQHTHNICHRIINGEDNNAPNDVTALWKEEQLKGVIHQYRGKDIYNAN